jgi:hypothetical protein
MAKPEIYVSTDVEADGPIPGPHSMLAFASVAFDGDGNEIAHFTRNLETLAEAQPHPETMEWWATQKEAWTVCRTDLVSPQMALWAYVAWVKSLPGKPVFVAYPAGYDFLFMYWYMIRFSGESPFSHSALDIKTYAMAILKKPFRDCTKRSMPRRWFSECKHTHVPLDDAREQGLMFIKMLKENQMSEYREAQSET